MSNLFYTFDAEDESRCRIRLRCHQKMLFTLILHGTFNVLYFTVQIVQILLVLATTSLQALPKDSPEPMYLETTRKL